LPNVKAIATELIIFPNIKTIPATKEYLFPRIFLAYKYVPPASGKSFANCADELAFEKATMLAINNPKTKEYEETTAAGAIFTNNPAPTIELIPRKTELRKVKVLLKLFMTGIRITI
jgi:hypothetical protein